MSDGCRHEWDGVTLADIHDALTARKVWEQRQAVFEQMRTDGLRRKSPPWRGAADMHFPLVDMQVDKNKPYYIEQVFGRETIAGFTALSKGRAGDVASVERWFDWMLRQETNFAQFVELAVDKMLMFGRVPVRVFWDAAQGRVVFEALSPVNVIVPPWTKDIQSADWICHVMRFSKFAYRRNEAFRSDADFVRRISGSGAEDRQVDNARKLSEGITHSANKDEIVVWELYVRGGEGWTVHTFSPVVPEEPVRPSRGLPYTRGVFAAGVPPFSQLSAELRDEGWYSSRGLAQRLAPFEVSLCADWNTQKDWQHLTCSPVFSAKGGLPNNANVRFTPGQILPFELAAVQQPNAPVDLLQQMANTRAIAEQLVGTPDFGLGQEGMPGNKQGSKTATEVQAISQVMGASVGMRGRRFRAEMSQVLSLAWSLCLQFAKGELGFFYNDEQMELDAGALVDGYSVRLRGTGDDSRVMRLQKAYGRMQTFGGNPMVNQRELVRACLEEDDPALARTLLLDQDMQQADQAEDQAGEIGIMLIGYPAQVNPTDNHAVHLQILSGFVQRRLQLGEPLTPEAALLFAQHGLGHFQILQKQNPQSAQPFAAAAEEFRRMGDAAQQALQQQTQIPQQ